MYTASREELAYIAGFFDGEGCITTSSGSNTLTVSASNTIRAPLEFIQRVFEGHVTIHKYSKPRNVLYDWVIYGQNAAEMLQWLLPYLIVKKEQALLGVELVMSRDKHRKASIILELRALKKPQLLEEDNA